MTSLPSRDARKFKRPWSREMEILHCLFGDASNHVFVSGTAAILHSGGKARPTASKNKILFILHSVNGVKLRCFRNFDLNSLCDSTIDLEIADYLSILIENLVEVWHDVAADIPRRAVTTVNNQGAVFIVGESTPDVLPLLR